MCPGEDVPRIDDMMKVADNRSDRRIEKIEAAIGRKLNQLMMLFYLSIRRVEESVRYGKRWSWNTVVKL